MQEALGVRARAQDENRPLTDAEAVELEQLLDRAEKLREAEDQMKQLGGGNSTVATGDPFGSWSSGGPGDRFVKSQAYQRIKSSDARPQQFSTGPVQVSDGPLMTKGTLLEAGAGGPGGGLVPPAYQPGVASRLFEPLAVSDLFSSSTTTASQVRYVNEGTATSGAAGVGEGAEKPQSTLAYSEVTEPVNKIATSLVVSDEMVEDAPSIQTYLNDRLSLFVRIEEERQLLRGSGTNELVGVFGRSGLLTYARRHRRPELGRFAEGCGGAARLGEPRPGCSDPAPEQLAEHQARDGRQ
jgi:HK97 family phage major capsid protein